MATPTVEEIQQDGVAMSVARALAIANEAALARGTDLEQNLISITEEAPPPDRVWRIHYGPRDYIHRRGGDLIILVNERGGLVQKILRGQ
jgi:hypothetical protein